MDDQPIRPAVWNSLPAVEAAIARLEATRAEKGRLFPRNRRLLARFEARRLELLGARSGTPRPRATRIARMMVEARRAADTCDSFAELWTVGGSQAQADLCRFLAGRYRTLAADVPVVLGGGDQPMDAADDCPLDPPIARFGRADLSQGEARVVELFTDLMLAVSAVAGDELSPAHVAAAADDLGATLEDLHLLWGLGRIDRARRALAEQTLPIGELIDSALGPAIDRAFIRLAGEPR